jgi:hypothetical protein
MSLFAGMLVAAGLAGKQGGGSPWGAVAVSALNSQQSLAPQAQAQAPQKSLSDFNHNWGQYQDYLNSSQPAAPSSQPEKIMQAATVASQSGGLFGKVAISAVKGKANKTLMQKFSASKKGGKTIDAAVGLMAASKGAGAKRYLGLG